jgi:hypothetical protein
VICTNGHQNPDDQSYCGTCGAPLAPPDLADAPLTPTATTDSAPARKLPALMLLTYGALGAAFIGSFLPWARVLFITVNGTDGDGVITALTAAGAAVFLYLATREEQVQRNFLVGAFLLSVVCAGVYLYDANQITRTVSEDAGLFGEISVEPQIGLYLGVLAAILAVGATATLVAQEYRPGLLDGLPAATAVALGAGMYAIALLFAGWWGLAVVAGLVAITVGFLQRKQAAAQSQSLRPATLALGAGVVGLLGGVSGFVVDDDGGTDLASCTDVFADGATTQRSWDDDGVTCVDEDGDRTYVITWEGFCWEQDEAPLRNNYGWGYVDQPWNTGEDAPDC